MLVGLGCNQFYGLDEVRIADPNFYTCKVTCTAGFGAGARVQTTTSGPITASPGGAHLVSDYPAGSIGTIQQGPSSPSGSNEIWWRVQFDDNLFGWVVETNLEVIGGTGVVVQEQELDVCVPSGFSNVDTHCAEMVAAAFRQHHASELPAGTGCRGVALDTPTKEAESCDGPCSDPTGVCVRKGWVY